MAIARRVGAGKITVVADYSKENAEKAASAVIPPNSKSITL